MTRERAMELLRAYGAWWTRQEYRTFRGQIVKGDIDGAVKGMERLLQRKELQNGERQQHH